MEREPERRPQPRRTAVAPPRTRAALAPALAVAVFAAGLSALVLLTPRQEPAPPASAPLDFVRDRPERRKLQLIHAFHLERSGPVEVTWDGRTYGRVWVDASGAYFYVPVLTRAADLSFKLVLGPEAASWTAGRCEGEVCAQLARPGKDFPMDIPLTHERGVRPVVWRLHPPEDPPPTHVVKPGELTPE